MKNIKSIQKQLKSKKKRCRIQFTRKCVTENNNNQKPILVIGNSEIALKYNE